MQSASFGHTIAPTTLRLTLLQLGYRPVPITAPEAGNPNRGKVPYLKDWPAVCASADEAEVRRWGTGSLARDTNTGLLLGELIGLDIDVPLPDLAERLDRIADAILGPTPLHRIGQAPKRLRCYRLPAPIRKIETPELFMSDGTKVQVEVLAEGQQFVGFGIHPVTGQPYTWPYAAPNTLPFTEVPVTSDAVLRDFVAAAEAVLRQAGGLTRKELEQREAVGGANAAQRADKVSRSEVAPDRKADSKIKDDRNKFFLAVNAKALASLDRWFPAIFPKAKEEAGTGAWRISSEHLGRQLEEDLSMHPVEGGMDWGTRESCSSIDVVIEWGGAADPKTAAMWLCEKMGLAPADLGWKESNAKQAREDSRSSAKTADTTEGEHSKGSAAPLDEVVERFNARYMVVNEAGKAVVFQPGFDPVLKRRRFDRLTFRDLLSLYMNERVEVGRDDKDRPITKNVADVWLHHERRKQFIHGVTFDPTARNDDAGVLNLWEGFAVKPKPGDWSLLRTHVHDVICDRDGERFSYLLSWMARMFQHPAEQGEVAVVMKSGEGTGKGTLAKALMRITGHHGLAISNSKHLVGNFNGHLRDVVFLFADEALFAGDRAHVGVLKSLITEPYLTVEGKFQNAVQSPNFLHVMMASNETWVVPASQDARRYFVLEVNDSKKGCHDYFKAIWKQMEEGGYEAMLHELLSRDLSTFNVRAVPTTEGLKEQRKLSLDTTHSWWLDCLERGYVFRSKLGMDDHFGRWHEKVTTEVLFASYKEYAKDKGERRPISREHLGKFLAGIEAKACRWRNGVVGERVLVAPHASTGKQERRHELFLAERATGYLFGPLEATRNAFVRVTNLSVTWDGGECQELDLNKQGQAS